jgi:hypothetical protein
MGDGIKVITVESIQLGQRNVKLFCGLRIRNADPAGVGGIGVLGLVVELIVISQSGSIAPCIWVRDPRHRLLAQRIQRRSRGGRAAEQRSRFPRGGHAEGFPAGYPGLIEVV